MGDRSHEKMGQFVTKKDKIRRSHQEYFSRNVGYM